MKRITKVGVGMVAVGLGTAAPFSTSVAGAEINVNGATAQAAIPKPINNCFYDLHAQSVNLGDYRHSTTFLTTNGRCGTLDGITKVKYKVEGEVRVEQFLGGRDLHGDIYNSCHGVYGAWVIGINYSVNSGEFEIGDCRL